MLLFEAHVEKIKVIGCITFLWHLLSLRWSVGSSVGRWVGRSVSRSFIISKQAGKLHFHAALSEHCFPTFITPSAYQVYFHLCKGTKSLNVCLSEKYQFSLMQNLIWFYWKLIYFFSLLRFSHCYKWCNTVCKKCYFPKKKYHWSSEIG